jgi:hypothetical protein
MESTAFGGSLRLFVGRGESLAAYPLWLCETVVSWRIVLTLDCEAERFIRTLCHRSVLPQMDLSNCAMRRRRSCHDVGRGETVRFTTSVSVCRMPRMSVLKQFL